MGDTQRVETATMWPARRSRGRLATLAAIACVAMSSGVRGQSSPQRPVPIRAQVDLPIVVALGAPLELTLRDAIERALRDNLDIQVERDFLELGDLRTLEARGAYDPLTGFNISKASSSTPTTSVLQAGAIATETSASRAFGPTFSQLLPSGGSIVAGFPMAQTSTNNAFSFVNPLYSSDLTLGVQQPLLRGFVNNPVRRELRILNLDSRITESDFRQAVAEIVQRVEQQYWNVVYSDAVQRVREESRDLSIKQRDQIGQKVQAGLLTPVALTAANAELAGREQDVLQAQVQVVAAQNGLKRLLAGDPRAPIWTERLVATDRPEGRDPPASLSDALRQALDRRPEIAHLALQTEQRRVDREFANWEAKPRVDFTGSFASIGRAGQVFRPIFGQGGIAPIGYEPDPTHPAFGGYRKTWDQVFDNTFPQWKVALGVQMPIFNRTAKSQESQADLSIHQLEIQIKAQQENIMVEVANAYETVLLQRRALEVARQARQLSQEQVDGEMERFDVGFTTTFEVLRYQRDLAEARVRELQAIVDYQLAIAVLRKATASNLDEHDLVLAKTPR